MKIAARITILFLLMAIVPTVIVGYLGYDIGKRTILKETTDHLVSINILKSRELERWVNDSKSSIEELAQRPLVRQYASVMAASHDMPDPSYRKAHKEIIENHLKPRLKYGVFNELFVMCSPAGHISASTDERQDGKYRNTRRYFIEGKSRTYVEGSYYSPALEQPAMTVSTPVKGMDGNTVAVLAGRLDLGELSKIMVQESGKSSTLDTYLVNSFNFFISEPRFGEDYVLKKAVRTEGIEAGLSGKDGFGFYKDYRGVPVIGAYKWLPEFKMCIITEIDQAEAFAPVKHLAQIAAGTVIAICIAAVFLGMLFARTISRPLRSLAAGAEEIGGGNLECKVGTSAKDEIGELSRAFDRMAQELQKTTVSRDEFSRERDFSDSVINSLPGVFYLFDENGRFYRWNKNFEIVTEYSAEEISQMSPLDIFSGEDKQLVADKIQEVFVKGEESVEAVLVTRSGRRIFYYFTGIRHAIGDRKFLVGVGIDISERKKIEEKEARTAQEWQSTFDSTNNAIWILDQDQRVLRSNRTAERFFHRPCGELIGKHCWEIVHGTAQPIPECPLLRARKSLCRETMELQVGEVWFEVTVDPILDAAGRYAGAVHSIIDITERKRAEERLKEHLDELRRWNDAFAGREMRNLELKLEVNELLLKAGLPARYESAGKNRDEA
ncbi:MAG: PAS domain S-box protein [Proteobacteria bacterium]|nr:PAS domain S-box protein [Pseudomonadota bacterium]MBU1712899.1 PAS domain S-box protein [Pseudomonadota bacterium]